jgi:hypothetical protein
MDPDIPEIIRDTYDRRLDVATRDASHPDPTFDHHIEAFIDDVGSISFTTRVRDALSSLRPELHRNRHVEGVTVTVTRVSFRHLIRKK